MEKLSTEEFIEKAKRRHGEKYNYYLSEYTLSKNKLKIICPQHGVFEQKAGRHLEGEGCPACGGKMQLSTEKFIQKAKEVHGEKYEYSLSEYMSSKTKLKIICLVHGVFEQTPNNHLRGQGCPVCKLEKQKSNTERFIEEAKKIHGDRYDYSLSEYTLRKNTLKIVCSIHGVFEQTACSHLQGSGCLRCKLEKQRFNTVEFIERAKRKHGNKYDYSLSEYTNYNKKLEIICPVHGVFVQMAQNHLSGAGCPACHYKKIASCTKEFIQKARKKHGCKYDYSQVEYINGSSKIKIICPSHGVFWQRPSDHLSKGKGCPVCSGHQLNTAEFIKKAEEVHAYKYDYSLSEYKGCLKTVKVICPDHGSFDVVAGEHLRRKQGCPCCRESGFNPTMPGVLYFLRFVKPFATFWKIGITNRTVRERFGKEFQFVIESNTWRFETGQDARNIEQKVIKRFSKYLFEQLPLFPILDKGGASECFTHSIPHNKVLAFIEKQIKDKAIPTPSPIESGN